MTKRFTETFPSVQFVAIIVLTLIVSFSAIQYIKAVNLEYDLFMLDSIDSVGGKHNNGQVLAWHVKCVVDSVNNGNERDGCDRVFRMLWRDGLERRHGGVVEARQVPATGTRQDVAHAHAVDVLRVELASGDNTGGLRALE